MRESREGRVIVEPGDESRPTRVGDVEDDHARVGVSDIRAIRSFGTHRHVVRSEAFIVDGVAGWGRCGVTSSCSGKPPASDLSGSGGVGDVYDDDKLVVQSMGRLEVWHPSRKVCP